MLFRLLSNLDRNVFEPCVFSLTTLGTLGEKIRRLGISVTALQMNRGFMLPLIALIRGMRAFRPDLVNTWLYHSDLLGSIAGKLAGARGIIWCIRSADFVQEDTKRTSRLVLKLCAILSGMLPDEVVYNSQKGVSAHKRYGYWEKKSRVIFNGIDGDLLRPNAEAKDSLCRSLGLAPSLQLVGMIARYDPLKNHAGFLQAAAIIKDALPEVRFILAGQGVDWSNQVLASQIESLGLQNYVLLLGPRNDVPYLLSALDMTCLSSLSEAFPNVVLESLACGVPCVATDVGDVQAIIQDRQWIVPVGDMPAMAAKCIKYLSTPISSRTNYKMKIRSAALAGFSIAAATSKFEKVYKNLVKTRVIDER